MAAKRLWMGGNIMKVITADIGYTIVRKHDGFDMGDTVTLGYDYSTGVKREDKEEYYEQVKIKDYESY